MYCVSSIQLVLLEQNIQQQIYFPVKTALLRRIYWYTASVLIYRHFLDSCQLHDMCLSRFSHIPVRCLIHDVCDSEFCSMAILGPPVLARDGAEWKPATEIRRSPADPCGSDRGFGQCHAELWRSGSQFLSWRVGVDLVNDVKRTLHPVVIKRFQGFSYQSSRNWWENPWPWAFLWKLQGYLHF